ncbi:hypothetical protein ACI2KT_34195 [Ensifer adhaerens]|uniref:hypothetical protein n=1 Tax=Ensifer adhaerens TaxID=106592 RepID=UPI00385036FB
MPRRPDPFFVYVLDHEKRQFTVEGPTFDETPWLDEWKNGPLKDRDLAVVPYDGLDGRSTRSKIAQEIAQQFGYEELPAGSILKGGDPR